MTLFCNLLGLDNNFKFTDEIDQKSLLFHDYSNIVNPKLSHQSRNIYISSVYKHVFGKEFVPNLSIIDLLFSEGPNSSEIINNSMISDINNPI